jgi:hypothetical protein
MCATARLIVYSRRGHDWTQTFASIARTAESLPVRHVVLDGDAVVQDTRGIADYHALRRELARKRVSIAEAPGLPLGAPYNRPDPQHLRKPKSLRLASVQDRFHNVGRQAGERQEAAHVGDGDSLLLC